MKCNHQHRMGVLGPFPTGREQKQSRRGGSRQVVCLHKDVVRRCLIGKQPRKLPWHRKLVPRNEAWQGKKCLISAPVDLSPFLQLTLSYVAVVERQLCLTALIYADNVQSSTLVTYMHPDTPSCLWKFTKKKNMQSTRLKKRTKINNWAVQTTEKELVVKVCSPLHTKSTSK